MNNNPEIPDMSDIIDQQQCLATKVQVVILCESEAPLTSQFITRNTKSLSQSLQCVLTYNQPTKPQTPFE